MARVTFETLECLKHSESGHDEPYLRYNGRRIGQKMSLRRGQAAILEEPDGTSPVVRDLEAFGAVDLFEDDWPDSDDFFARITVSADEAGLGPRARNMRKGSEATYTLYYRVDA